MTDICKYNLSRTEFPFLVDCYNPIVIEAFKKELGNSEYWKNRIGPFTKVRKGNEEIDCVELKFGTCAICKHYEL